MASTASNLVQADWWTQTGDELAETQKIVFGIVRDENAWRLDKDDYHWGLYEGTGEGGTLLRSRKNMTYLNATLPDNVCKMSVDTLTAKVATIRPIPQVYADRGNWRDQRRARKMRQFIEGAFFEHKVHEQLASQIIKDALVCRAGVVQVYADGKKTKVERVHAETLYVDDWDAEFGEPLSMYRLRTMDRGKAIAKFGKTAAKKKALEKAGRLSSSVQVGRDEERSSTVTRVELLESWHRCPDHDDDDEDHECIGKHTIVCDGASLFEEDWPHNFFPFAELVYDTPNRGKWGTSLVQSLEGYQVNIDKANAKLDEMYDLSGKYIVLRDGSGIFKSDVVNGLRVLHCKAGPYDPVVFDADLVNEHMRQRPPELIERALNAAGISQMAAQSQKPSGIESGIALQTLDDVESQRHIVFGRRFESWCLDVARLLVECVKKIAKEHGEYAVKVPMRGAYLPLKWADVEIDGYQLQMQSVGQLYMSFAGKLDKLKTLFEMGAIDRGTFMRQLDAGDLQSELDLETVDRLRADEMIEAMLDAEEPANDNGGPDRNYFEPDAYLPLAWAHRRAHQRRNQAQTDSAPQYVLDLIGRWIDDVQYLMDKAAPPTQGADLGPLVPQGTAPLAPPPGAPMPPAGPVGPPPPMSGAPPLAA